jgi:hypothetical protein
VFRNFFIIPRFIVWFVIKKAPIIKQWSKKTALPLREIFSGAGTLGPLKQQPAGTWLVSMENPPVFFPNCPKT